MTYINELRRADQDHHVHPWHVFEVIKEIGPNVIEGGEGLYVWGSDGKRVLDAVGGLWCTNIGLGRPEMADAIAAQVRALSYGNTFGTQSNQPAARLSRKIASLTPGDLNRVFFTTGGSTAVDTAVRLVNFYQNSRGKPEKRHLIARREAYHGSTYVGMSLTAKTGDRLPQFNYIEDFIHHVSAPYTYRRPAGMDEDQFCDFLIEELEQKILALGPENVGAFFAEPILGSGGVIVPPETYNRRTWELTRKYDILYVADEVVTAFGRLGHWFASKDVYGVEPDIITVAKGLSSGYLPIGAAIFSDRIYDAMAADDPNLYFANGFTYSGHPVCCAAALANLEIMENERLLENVRRVAPYFRQRLEELLSLPTVGDVRGEGFMVCIENVAEKATKAMLPPEIDIGRMIARETYQQGLMVRPIGHLNIMSPPLTMTEGDVDFVVDTLGSAIRAVTDRLVRDKVLIG